MNFKQKEFFPKKNARNKLNTPEDSIKDNRSFNGLTAKEWVQNSRNVWEYSVSSRRTELSKNHGATFSIDLAEKLIKLYSNKNDVVFDPFLGIGTTSIASSNLERKSIGIELNQDYYITSLNQLGMFKNNHQIINDDCRNMTSHIKENEIQLTLTSPPYANFIQKSLKDRKTAHKKSMIRDSNNSTIKQYSNDPNDFGNLEYPDFMKEIQNILKLNYKITKPNGYSLWIVKDHRDTANNIPYISFHSDLAQNGEKAGWKYHDLIILNQNEKRKLIALGYPSVFYTNQNCSFIVVFRKS